MLFFANFWNKKRLVSMTKNTQNGEKMALLSGWIF